MDIVAAGIQTIVHVSQEVASLRRVIWWWNTAGWPVGVSFAAALAVFTLLANFVAIIAISSLTDFDGGVAKLYEGDCNKVSTINTWVHVGINILSSLLLGGSNYCMQVLIAPTRGEIDEAHRQGKWLDIGVPSFRNLKRVKTRKAIMWWLLGLSSLPMHLVYNSTFFETIGVNEYDVIVADKSFLAGKALDTETIEEYGNFTDIRASLENWQKSPDWAKLNRDECIDEYATEFLSRRRNLVAIVTNSSTPTNRSVQYVHEYSYEETFTMNFYGWICSAPDRDWRYEIDPDKTSNGDCSSILSEVKSGSDKWNVEGWDVDYCVSELTPGRCTLSFSRTFGFIIIICNLGKCVTMLAVILYIRDTPLTTIGDATCSFLNTTDPSTEGMCLLSKGWVRRDIWRRKLRHAALRDTRSVRTLKSVVGSNSRHYLKLEAMVLKYEARERKWFSSVGRGRWFFFLLLSCTCVFSMTVLLGLGIHDMRWKASVDVVNLGFGELASVALISGTTTDNSLTKSVFLANLPQAILSFMYLYLNSVITAMVLSSEWSDYGHQRKPLRVSFSRLGQKSTFYLQLPYQYGLPLLALSAFLHWLVSQSIFLAKVSSYDKNDILVDPALVSTCGYSPLAVIVTISVACAIILLTMLLSLRVYRPGIPLAASCSAAISAACHPEKAVDATAPLMWGVTSSCSEFPGHCSFSDQEVAKPEDGSFYS